MSSIAETHYFFRLKDAIMNKDLREVEEILKECEENDLCIGDLESPSGLTLLHVAVESDSPAMLQLLLAYSDEEDVNQFDHNCLTPMTFLLWNSQDLDSAEEMLLSLLAAKADPNLLHPPVGCECREYSSSRLGPLFCALQEEQWRLAEILLDAGADPRRQDCDCHHINFCLENPHLVQRLLDLGCYHPDLLKLVISDDYEGKCEESVLHLCKIILPYHSGPELNLCAVLEAAENGFYEVLILLLTELKPGINLEFTPFELIFKAVSSIVTPQNYKRFLTAYFRFVEVNQFDGAAYLYILFTARTMELLNILLEEVKERRLEITGWRVLLDDCYSSHFNSGETVDKWSQPLLWSLRIRPFCWEFLVDDSELCFDFLSTAARYVSSPRIFGHILPLMLELGLKSSPLALASMAMRAAPDEYEFHLVNPEFRDVLTRLSSNCCEQTGTCWLRQPFFISLCYEVLISIRSRGVLLTLLRLGVDIRDVFRHEPFIKVSKLDENAMEIIQHFEPRPMSSWLPQSPAASAIVEKFGRREPASLKELSRQAFRSGLGSCRIEEKIVPFKFEIPKTIYNYLCFRDNTTLAYFEKNEIPVRR